MTAAASFARSILCPTAAALLCPTIAALAIGGFVPEDEPGVEAGVAGAVMDG
jgi:hypothetical protein